MSDNNEQKDVTQNVICTLSEDEIDMLNLRKNIIDSKTIEVKLLQNECDGYVSFLRDKYKLENGKEFIIDNEGKITEVIKKQPEE